MPSIGAVECILSSDSNDALILRFPDDREKAVPLCVAARSSTLQNLMDGVGRVGTFTFSDPHGHLECWLQCVDDMTATARAERRLGALVPLKLVKYLKVRLPYISPLFLCVLEVD
jgi:hypothetical protein